MFYLGATPVLGVPQDKATGFTVVTVILVIVLYFVAGALVTATTGGMGLATTGAIAQVDRNTSIDLGSLGKVNVNGDTTTITANGHTTTVRTDGNNATLTSDGDATVVSVPK